MAPAFADVTAEQLLGADGETSAPWRWPRRALVFGPPLGCALLVAAAVAALPRGGGAARSGSSWWSSFSGGETECAEAYQQCGGEGYTGVACCQSGCICAGTGNEYFMQCEPPDVNGTKCDASKASYAEEVWAKESTATKEDAERVEKTVRGLKAQKDELTELVAKLKEEVEHAEKEDLTELVAKSHSSLKAKTAELKKVDGSLLKALHELKTKRALADSAAEKLAGWQNYSKLSGSDKSSHDKHGGSNKSKTHGNKRAKEHAHSHKHEAHGDEGAEKDGNGKTGGDRDLDDGTQQLQPELTHEWDNDDW